MGSTSRNAKFWLTLALVFAIADSLVKANAQGTITFNANPNWSGTYYVESGMAFSLVVPQGATRDDMAIVPPGFANVPQNSTPLMGWFRQFNPYNYVSLSLTNGALFGLTSVQLADPNSPSLSPVSISFIGHLSGGGTVTNTFTTPGAGANTLAPYTFNTDFASGLTSVDIFASKWAMDNLVFVVPEPAAGTLTILGLAVFAAQRIRRSNQRQRT